MRKFIAEAKAKGATPVVLSLTVRNIWKDTSVERGPGMYSQWSAEIAKAAGVQFLDVTNAIADHYERMGPEKVKDLFPEDHTHTSPAGADLNASLVVATIKGAKGFTLAGYLSAQGKAVEAYPAAPPAVKIPLPNPTNPNLPTLFLIGDSTVRNGRGDGSNGQWGWGEPLGRFFDAVENQRRQPRRRRPQQPHLFHQGYWEDTSSPWSSPATSSLMQVGHNDGGPLDDAARARGTLRGAGDEAREIDNPISRQRETVHTYGWYLKKFIADARAKGATPILCTLIPRKTWKDGKIVHNRRHLCWMGTSACSQRTRPLDRSQ